MEAIADLIRVGPELMSAAKALASIPLGDEIITDYDLVLYHNGTGCITVGDVVAAKSAMSQLFPDARP